MRRRRTWLSAFASLATGFAALAQSDITQPGDLVVPSSSNSPGSEGVANVIDNKPTKYLNFDGKNNQPSGFSVKPSVGRTLVTGLTIQSANDGPERDPATYELSGSDDGTTFTPISSGDVPEFGTERFKTVSISFANTSAYLWYKLNFPTTRASSTCCMQVAEVEFLGTVIKDDVTQPGDVIVASSANSPGSEGAANAIDNKPTKYLNFDGKNNQPSGFTVTPGVGATVVTGISLQSANDGPERDPKTYELSGSNDGGTTFTPISSGDVPEFGTTRFKTVYTLFANTKSYKTYKLIFPTTRGNSTCCMQVAEVELLGDVAPQDVTIPGDLTVASSSNSPGSEGVANVIDNKPTKYLNFDGKNNQPSGFTVTPSAGKSIVTGLTIQSANDGPERDPKTYELSGSNDGTTFTPISSGDVPEFGTERFKTVEISFANAVAYSSYRLMFPTTRGASTCCMQVAEVEFLGFVFDPTKFPKFLTKPVNTPALSGAKARFFVTLDGPWRLQWYKNGTAIPGANQLAYETDVVTATSGNDSYYAIAKNGPLETQSDAVKVQVFTPSVTKSIGLNFRGGGANGAPTDTVETDIAGAFQQAYWNNFPRGTDNQDAPVKNSSNEDTDITVEFNPSGGWGSGTGSDSGDRKILNGYLSGADGGGNPVEVTFNNVPNGTHSILVYAVNRPLAFNDSDYHVEGLTSSATISIRAQNADEYNAAPGFVRGTSTDPTKRSVANYIRFDNIKPDANGTIKLVAQGLPEPGESPAGAAPVNAVQLLLNPPAAIDPPVVTTQPKSQNLVSGAPATFTVAATGANKKYQWRKGNNALSDGGKVSGSSTESLAIAGADASDEGTYSVTVSNDGGSVNSASAVLSVYNGKIADRLAAHWRFDEKAGFKAANSVAGGQAGDLQGYSDNSGWVAGRVGGALSFDGSTQFVIVPDYTKPATAEAISAWVWTDASQAATFVANSGKRNDNNIRLSQFEFGITADGDLNGRIVAGPNAYIGSEGADKPLSNGEWHHVVLTADGARLTIYRDGAAVSTLDYAGRITDATAPCIGIGALLDNTLDPNDSEDKVCAKAIDATYWTGKIDDLALWTRPLGASEVTAIYNLGKSGKSLAEVPDVAAPVTTPPALSVKANADGTITVTFEGTLEVAPDVAGPYQTLAAPSPLTFAPNAARQFARARR